MRHVSRNIAARGVVNGWGWIPQSRAAPIPRGDSAPRFGAAIRCGDSVPPRSIATFAPGRRGEGAKGRRGEGAKGRRIALVLHALLPCLRPANGWVWLAPCEWVGLACALRMGGFGLRAADGWVCVPRCGRGGGGSVL